MGSHARWGRRAPRDPVDPPPRARRHPVALALGMLLVAAIAGITAFAGWTLYSQFAWQSSAAESAAAVATAVEDYAVADDSPPVALDAVAGSPTPEQTRIADLPYAADVPSDVTRIRITEGGALSVLTSADALCSGVTLNMSTPGKPSTGAFFCGDALPPGPPEALSATPRDESVILEWSHPSSPVEDYTVELSADDGGTWTPVADGVTALSRAVVGPLVNGREYAFRVTALNLVGASTGVTTTGSPFTQPGPPTGVTAKGGFRAVVSWTAPADDGGRPVTGYLVKGRPTGTCTVEAPATRCEIPDLPAAPGYTFIVRAVNDAGAGAPSSPETPPIAVYSAPGRPVALIASAGDGVVILSWTDPLQDGNTPITDYVVEYRVVGDEDWTAFTHPPSAETLRTVTGLTNGTAYEFRVMAVNAVGMSEPPLTTATETPATIPGPVPGIEVVAGNAAATLTWTPPLTDGESPITDYAIEFRAAGEAWQAYADPVGTTLTSDVTDLVNGTRYAFRVAAVNRMGQGPWSPADAATPVGPPGPVQEPESVGSLKAIDLTWQPPANDGGRPLRGYRVDYKLSTSPDWIRVARVAATETALTISDVVPGESYDIRIVAINEAGVGPANPEGSGRPTLAGVIADETPPAPLGLTAVPGDGTVTLTWQASPAGRKSPITAYTVTGTPEGTCVTTALTCVVRGLANGTRYTFTVSASNAHITGPESEPVTAMPMVFNAASGGVESTYTKGGRTYRVHTFTTGGTLTISSAAQPFTVLVVGGGGGSATAADETVYVGGGGGLIDARRITLPTGVLNVTVGAGGSPGATGGTSSLDAVGTAPPGAAGAAGQAEFSPTTVSKVTGTPVTYGGNGTPTSGPGVDGRGVGGGGPTANRGGNGVVIVRYEVAG